MMNISWTTIHFLVLLLLAPSWAYSMCQSTGIHRLDCSFGVKNSEQKLAPNDPRLNCQEPGVMRNVKIHDQGEYSICYASVMAQMIAALTNNEDICILDILQSIQSDTNKSMNDLLNDGGYSCTAYKAIQKNGYCTGCTFAEDKKISQQCYQILKESSLEQALKILNLNPSKTDFCGRNRKFIFHLNSKCRARSIKGNDSSDDIIQKMIPERVPRVISYCVNALTKNPYDTETEELLRLHPDLLTKIKNQKPLFSDPLHPKYPKYGLLPEDLADGKEPMGPIEERFGLISQAIHKLADKESDNKEKEILKSVAKWLSSDAVTKKILSKLHLKKYADRFESHPLYTLTRLILNDKNLDPAKNKLFERLNELAPESTKNNKEHFTQEVVNTLSNKVYPLIHSLDSRTSCERHASLIIGNRCHFGKVQVLIRNSWGIGLDCQNTYRDDIDCEKTTGSFWIDAENLAPYTYSITNMVP